MELSRHKLLADFAKFNETNKTSGTFDRGLPEDILTRQKVEYMVLPVSRPDYPTPAIFQILLPDLPE